MDREDIVYPLIEESVKKRGYCLQVIIISYVIKRVANFELFQS